MQWGNRMNTMHRQPTVRIAPRAQAGFSLIEILIVVALIATIAGVVANQVFGGQDRAKVRIAQSQLAALAGKVEQFEMDTGALPNSLNDLVSMSGTTRGWLGPYSKEAELKDPWNTPIEFRGGGDNERFTLISLGADRKSGGTGVDADINSND